MSNMAFHADAIAAFLGKFWGTKIKDEGGTLKDTGVQEFVEEMIRTLTSLGPITLDRPLEFINPTNGPAIKIYNTGDTDWMGIRLRDKAGNEAQFGIGLGNEGITANNFVPHPKYSTDPVDNHKFYSETGGGAGTDRDHPQAVEANNGLIGYEYLIDDFTVPQWNFFQQPEFHNDLCGSYYTWQIGEGEAAILPTYIPQSKLILATADQQIQHGDSGTATDSNGTTYSVDNPLELCIAIGSAVLLACIDGEYIIIKAEEAELFTTGTTSTAFTKGGSGQVNVNGVDVDATSPYDALTCDVAVAMSRPDGCSGWVIVSAECWTEDACV